MSQSIIVNSIATYFNYDIFFRKCTMVNTTANISYFKRYSYCMTYLCTTCIIAFSNNWTNCIYFIYFNTIFINLIIIKFNICI